MDRDHATGHFEGRIIQSAGPARVVLWDTICLQNAGNEVRALAAIGSEITYQRALEAQNRVSQKLESVGRMAAGIAHDFNSILTVVRGHTEQVLREFAKSDKAHASLRAIDEAVMSCSRQLDQLLTFGRKQCLHPERIDLNEVIAAETGIIRSLLGAGIELIITPAAGLWLVDADPTQIQRILANLVTNAREATPRGGKVIIETANVTVGEGDAAHPGVEPGAFVSLSVSDNGIGLTEEVKRYLFEPFFTTKEIGEGTGLGLPSVYGIVMQSGGHIVVRGEAGKGSTFEILLPASTG
jgi:signal transduction histidine kinase